MHFSISSGTTLFGLQKMFNLEYVFGVGDEKEFDS